MKDQYDMTAEAYAESVNYRVMDDEDLAFESTLFAALGNVTRLRIAELLIRGECTVNEVAHEVGILQPNASLNLSILQRAGIAKVTPRGSQRYYSLRGPRIVHILILAKVFRTHHASAIQSESTVIEDDQPEYVPGRPLSTTHEHGGSGS